MLRAITQYFSGLSSAFGEGWNRFWFAPSDPYPLGVIRALTGVLAVWLQVTLLPDVGRFFAAGGWLPLDLLPRTTLYGEPLTYLRFFSTPGQLLFVHCVGLVILVAFALGLWTRLTSVLALIVVLSNIHRAPMITTQLEPVLTLVMFYLCLGPAGASCSLDRWLLVRLASGGVPEPAPASFTATLSLRLIQVHLALLVATCGLAKLLSDAWWMGTAAWLLAARPESRVVDLTGVHSLINNLCTHLIVGFELVFPILVWNRWARPLLLAVGVGVWLLVGLLTGQVTYALALFTASLSFWSPAVLRACAGVFGRRSSSTGIAEMAADAVPHVRAGAG